MKSDNIIGIDLAKDIFHICVMGQTGRVLARKRLRRTELFEWVSTRCNGTVVMEACGGAHYWARRFSAAGFGVRIIAAQFVKPFVKSNKNDRIDAEAICEAASRPTMRFVSMRTADQQDIQNLHRIRDRLVRQRTALSNEIRGLLLEYGIILRRGIGQVRRELHTVIEGAASEQSNLWKETFLQLHEEFQRFDERIDTLDRRIHAIANQNPLCKELMKVPGVGELGATAIVAAVGDGKQFKNGRQFAAWLGLTPRQFSTGGKPSLGGISKRGDCYIRKLLILGSRSSAIAATRRKGNNAENQTDRWLFDVANRRGNNRAIVALANKTARRIWIVLSGKEFKQPEQLFALAA